jgi:hypothetical protein
VIIRISKFEKSGVIPFNIACRIHFGVCMWQFLREEYNSLRFGGRKNVDVFLVGHANKESFPL